MKNQLRTTAFALALIWTMTQASGQSNLHDRIFASSPWREFRDKVMVVRVPPVTDAELQAPCREGVATDSEATLDAAVEACMQAALESLDESSVYYTPEARRRMAKRPNDFVGIGLELRQAASRNGDVEIVSPVHGSPAERAGLLPGDLIFSIANRPTLGVPLMDAVQSMRGEAGTFLDLRVRRPGIAETMHFSVQREPIRLLTTRAGLPSPGVLWLRISQLRHDTRRDLLADVARLKRQSPEPLKQVILDLRGCPGGLLEAVVAVAALWTPEGTAILRVVDLGGPPGRLYRATREDYAKADTGHVTDPADGLLHQLPLTILVNERTGAGAEALAQVLRETRQAQVFGQTTSGLAAIETITPLQSGGAMRIRSGSMESPGGFSWESRGLIPDVTVSMNAATNLLQYGALPGDSELAAVLESPRIADLSRERSR